MSTSLSGVGFKATNEQNERAGRYSNNLGDRLKMKCIACGSEALIEGTIRDSNGHPLDFPRAISRLLNSFLVLAAEKFERMDASTVKAYN